MNCISIPYSLSRFELCIQSALNISGIRRFLCVIKQLPRTANSNYRIENLFSQNFVVKAKLVFVASEMLFVLFLQKPLQSGPVFLLKGRRILQNKRSNKTIFVFTKQTESLILLDPHRNEATDMLSKSSERKGMRFRRWKKIRPFGDGK